MSLLDTNLIQIALINESDLEPVEWIEKYSERFRIIIEGGITNIEEIKFLLYKN